MSFPSQAVLAKAPIVRFVLFLLAFHGARRESALLAPMNAFASLYADLVRRLTRDEVVRPTCRDDRFAAFTCSRKITDDNRSMDLNYAARFRIVRSDHLPHISTT